jgi:coproporphyrinogen III oxidase-like Fe-S oxidoreductase
VTVYQMELPFNTVFSKELKVIGQDEPQQVADWPTKRAWLAYAFDEFLKAGYDKSSAYTVVKRKPGKSSQFVYRDSLWHGADMFGTGVASFGHVNGVHMQNYDTWETYSDAVGRGEIPLNRAYRPTDDERMIRELVLQLKLGSVRPQYFRDKYGVDILERFDDELASLKREGYLAEASERTVALTRNGLLRVDVLLPRFFHPEHVGIRYT